MEGEPHHAFKDVVALGRSLYALVDPYAGLTCPMTYEGNDGRQYLAVNVAAGATDETRGNERLVVFALPRPSCRRAESGLDLVGQSRNL